MENIKIHTPFLVFRYRLVNLQSGIFAFRRKEIITMWENYPSCRDRHRGKRWKRFIEYYGAAEPPVRCGESHLSGLTEPPHFIY